MDNSSRGRMICALKPRVGTLSVALLAAFAWSLAAQSPTSDGKPEGADIPPVVAERLYVAFRRVIAFETRAGKQGVPETTEVWRRDLTVHVRDLAVSPDGKLLAVNRVATSTPAPVAPRPHVPRPWTWCKVCLP